MSVDSKMTAIADGIREKTGKTGKLTLDDMASGVDEVYEAGMSKAESDFWDIAQNYGQRTNYTCAFAGKAWRDENYNPKYPINGTEGCAYLYWNSELTDTKVAIDIGDTDSNGYSRFVNATKLVTIRKLIVKEQAIFISCFTGCTNLENITVEGVIGNDIDLSMATKLTHDSLMSIINALKDYSSTTATHTFTIGTANHAKLADEEKAIATNKGWTLA